jgi:hypothetical protein
MMELEKYKIAKRLAEQAFPGARILASDENWILVDCPGWFAPQYYTVGDGCLIREGR